jgi:hypothetical protein
MINPTSVSYEEIKKDLENYIQQLSETDSSWKDFFETSTGQVLLELLAGFGAFLLYKTYVARREAYLHQAQLLSSAISIAEGLSYPAYRGIPPKLILSITPDSPLSLPKYSVIGVAKDYDILLGEDLVVNAGQTVQTIAYVGKYVEEEKDIVLTSDTRKYIFVRFLQPISEIFDFEVNGEKVEFSTKIKDLSDKWVLLTNHEFSLDAFYLNNDSKYKTGNKAKIKGIYFDYKDEISQDDCQFYYNFTINSISPPTQRDTVDTIRVVAPYYADTSLIVRAREDYKKLFFIKFPYLRDVVTHDDYSDPKIVYISYLKQDLSLLSEEEKSEFLNFVDSLRPMGIPLPQIVDPEEITTTLDFSIKLEYSVSTSLVEQAVNDTIEKFSKFLGKDLDLYEMENYLEENYDFIKIARVVNNGSYTLNWNSYVKVSNYTITYL